MFEANVFDKSGQNLGLYHFQVQPPVGAEIEIYSRETGSKRYWVVRYVYESLPTPRNWESRLPSVKMFVELLSSTEAAALRKKDYEALRH
jgi:hypothetical protein